MIASSSTFRPLQGRVIWDLFRQSHAVRHATEGLVYSNHTKEAADSSYLAIIFERIVSGVPCFSIQQRSQYRSRISAGTGVGVVAVKLSAIEYLTLDLSRGMNGFTLPIVTLGHDDSGDLQNATEFQH